MDTRWPRDPLFRARHSLEGRRVRHSPGGTIAFRWGGRIDADLWLRDGRCFIRVTDTGVGLNSKTQGLGTGLSNLRERLKLAFSGEARFSLTEVSPRGVCAEISFPVRESEK